MNDVTTYTQAQLDASVAAAVATAKTEATQATAALTAAHDAALQAAVATARTEATAAERTRISTIVKSEEAKGRVDAALNIALASELSADVAKTTLAVLPKSSVGAAAPASGAHGLFLDPSATNPAPAKADHGWGDVMAELNKSAR